VYASPGGLVEALRGVDAAFGQGVTAVVGASGSGKSTLLRLLAGLERPTAGSVTVAGSQLGFLSSGALRDMRRAQVSFVAQRPAENFLAHLTLAEHVRLPGGGQTDAASALFDALGLGERQHERPAALSGGEQARAAFALALLRRTPLVLLDEPTAELDTHSAAALLSALRDAAGRAAFVVATHDPDVIAAADSAVHLRSGRVVPHLAAPVSTVASAPAGPVQDSAPLIEARGVSKRYERGTETVRAVDGVDLALRGGELTVLVGRSGSGKSTLLGLLAGWYRPDTGAVTYTGRAPGRAPWKELAVVPQRFGLTMELSVRENIALPLRLAGRPDEHAVDALLEDLELGGLASRRPSEISIGQQQRVAVARALVLAPAVLLLDEPASHQDAASRDAVWRRIAAAATAGAACLVVTHDPDVGGFASRTLEMRDGLLVS
jgi:putative ABC transport system ATP-binding protein